MVVIAAGRDEGRARAAGGEGKAQDAAVEIERPLQIGHFQVDMADPHAGIDGGKAEGFFLDLDGLGHATSLTGPAGLRYPDVSCRRLAIKSPF